MSYSNRDTLKEELIQTDHEYRHLHDQHQACERRLSELQHQNLPSQQDELEEKQIKRQKLFFKDRMAAHLATHTEAAATA